MTPFLQYVVTGLSTGATYALVGLGIALVVQVTRVINFAQGEFVMLGSLGFALGQEHGLPLWLAVLLAVGGTTLVGIAVERLVIAPARQATVDRLILLTIGASIVIEGAALVVVGTEPHFARPFSAGAPIRLAGVNVIRQYLWVGAVTVVAVALVALFLTRTMTGRAMRATAMDAEAARLVGISPGRMSLIAFALAAGLGAIGGVVLAPLQAPDVGIGIALGLKGFAAAVIGGLDYPAGAVAGGLLLGVIEAVAAGYLPSGYADAVAFGLLAIVLVSRPTGLFKAVPAVRV